MSKPVAPLPEELFDRVVSRIEGPLNRRVERLMKSKLYLAPLGVMWTVWARTTLAVRDGSWRRLVRAPSVDEVKGREAPRAATSKGARR